VSDLVFDQGVSGYAMVEEIRRLKFLSVLGPRVGVPTGTPRDGVAGLGRVGPLPGLPSIVEAGRTLPSDRSADGEDSVSSLAQPITNVTEGSKESDKARDSRPVTRSPRRGRRKRRSNDADPPVEPVTREPKRALTVEEAAYQYSISRSSLYKLINDGVIPDVTIPGTRKRVIPRDAMEALISGGRP
jgi:excisionase family DNA binding protein